MLIARTRSRRHAFTRSLPRARGKAAGLDRRVEVKVRANGFQRLYDWLTGADLLIVRADRQLRTKNPQG